METEKRCKKRYGYFIIFKSKRDNCPVYGFLDVQQKVEEVTGHLVRRHWGCWRCSFHYHTNTVLEGAY